MCWEVRKMFIWNVEYNWVSDNAGLKTRESKTAQALTGTKIKTKLLTNKPHSQIPPHLLNRQFRNTNLLSNNTAWEYFVCFFNCSSNEN